MVPEWGHFLSAMTLALARISGIIVFAPFFSAAALPARSKAVFALALAYLLAPVVASLQTANATLCLSSLLAEVGVGLIYGLSLALINEMLLFAGQIAGIQFSFSLVNLMDPASSIQTPLLSELFQLMGTLVILGAGLDRVLIASLVRSFQVVPLGGYVLTTATSSVLLRAAGGVFLAALQLAAPVLAATLLIEVAVALLARLSPQLPVMSLTVPLKTLTGFALLAGSLALWPRFIEVHFDRLLDLAENLLRSGTAGG
ncbi:MAG TPA: flagellar biosynthetic protein FliR [Terracidiphilus sp.]|jgi:flagellar biosynthetic protein FliR|nr:flagellar biosynthetic protein FliR [Terracidiphilus sp.]